MKKFVSMALVLVVIASVGCMAFADSNDDEFAEVLIYLIDEWGEFEKEEGIDCCHAIGGIIEDDGTITTWARLDGDDFGLPEYDEIVMYAYDCYMSDGEMCSVDIVAYADLEGEMIDISDMLF